MDIVHVRGGKCVHRGAQGDIVSADGRWFAAGRRAALDLKVKTVESAAVLHHLRYHHHPHAQFNLYTLIGLLCSLLAGWPTYHTDDTIFDHVLGNQALAAEDGASGQDGSEGEEGGASHVGFLCFLWGSKSAVSERAAGVGLFRHHQHTAILICAYSTSVSRRLNPLALTSITA